MNLDANQPAASPRPKKRKRLWRVVGLVFAAVLAGIVALYCVATGPTNFSQYPPAESSPYRLPWAAGKTFRCCQSNRGIVSHRGWEQFAYDFDMPVGTEVCAARGGKVIKVVMEHDGHGRNRPNNVIAIQHDDGTFGYYLHLKKDGSRVKVGDVVKQGQVIAASGHVGKSLMPHLHFHVTDANRKGTLPVSFADVRQDAGIPRMFKNYTAGSGMIE